jgi:hypothetical protein
MIFNLINNFIKISFYSGLGFGLLGFFISIIECWYKATNRILPIQIEYNQLYINYYNYFVEYIESILFFTSIFFVGGFVCPLSIVVLSILTIIYFINRQTKLIK